MTCGPSRISHADAASDLAVHPEVFELNELNAAWGSAAIAFKAPADARSTVVRQPMRRTIASRSAGESIVLRMAGATLCAS